MTRTYRTATGLTATALVACALTGCTTTSDGRAAASGATAAPLFTVRTTPAGASVETTLQYRCTSPCEVPVGSTAFVATVTMLGYKPVQIPVAAGRNPGPVTIKLVPQDPGAGAPNPVATTPRAN